MDLRVEGIDKFGSALPSMTFMPGRLEWMNSLILARTDRPASPMNSRYCASACAGMSRLYFARKRRLQLSQVHGA